MSKDEEMLNSIGIVTGTNREPWLAVTLSWFLPGAGHVYSGLYRRGVLLLSTKVFLYLLLVASLASRRTPLLLSPLLYFCGSVALPGYACLDSFRTTKRLGHAGFESNRSLAKDPWLAVFLSLLLPGAGHAYLLKGGYSLLFFMGFVAVYSASFRAIQWFMLYTLFRVVLCAHAHTVAQIHRKTKKGNLAFCLLFLVSVQCAGRIVLPVLNEHFVVDMHCVALGTSMIPTLRDGDRVILNKLAYRWSYPKIGDVVAFEGTSRDPGHDRIVVFKRIGAIGGEVVQMDGRIVRVDGQEREFSARAHQEAYSATEPALETFGRQGNPYLVYGVDKPYTVPAGQYFVLGDNHRYSVDSRCYGAVPADKIIGKVVKIYLPVRRAGIVR